MRIIGLETSGKTCGVALLEDGEIRSEYNLNLGLRHSDFVFHLIERVLRDAHWQLENIEGIAVDKGPGSFTGIRIGLTVVRTLGQILKIPLAGVTSLDVLVENVPPSNFLLSPFIDALGGEIYTSLYQWEKDKWQRLAPYQVEKADSWINHLLTFNKPVLFVGETAIIHKKKIKIEPGSLTNFFERGAFLSARNVAFLGQKQLIRSQGVNFDRLLPFYIRRSYAETAKDLSLNQCRL